MANSLGTLSAGILVAQQALANLKKILPAIAAMSTDFSNSVALKGETLKSRLHGGATVSDFGSAATDVTVTDVPVTLNQEKQVKEVFTRAQYSVTNRDLIAERAENVATAIANHFVGAVAALFVEADYTNETVEALADTDSQTIIDLRAALVGRGVPGDLNIISGSPAYAKWLGNDVITNASKNSGNDGVITSGQLKGVFGFKNIFEYPDLQTSENLLAIALGKSAAVVMSRAPATHASSGTRAQYPGNNEYVTDADLGLTILVNEYVDADTFAVTVRYIFLYGAAKGDVRCAQRLVSA